MIELATILNENGSFGEYTAGQSITASGGEHNPHEKWLQLISAPVHATLAYGTTANASTNQTVACPFIAIQRNAYYEEYRLEDTSRSDIFFVSLAELSSLKAATETHIRNQYGLTRLFCATVRYPEIQLGNELLVSLGSPWMPTQVIQEKEEQETIRADTNRTLSFGELLYALDRISRPIEVEDIPLSVDPDDYPVV